MVLPMAAWPAARRVTPGNGRSDQDARLHLVQRSGEDTDEVRDGIGAIRRNVPRGDLRHKKLHNRDFSPRVKKELINEVEAAILRQKRRGGDVLKAKPPSSPGSGNDRRTAEPRRLRMEEGGALPAPDGPG